MYLFSHALTNKNVQKKNAVDLKEQMNYMTIGLCKTKCVCVTILRRNMQWVLSK